MDAIDAIKTALEEMRPFIQEDGGDLEFVSFQDGQVRLRMLGACSNCAMSTYTLKLGIEERLKQTIPNVREVIAV